jgi:membrane protease YdiL (CAAX protease family)
VQQDLLFGFMHQRWIAGSLAGAVFALVMYRSRRLSDAIAAHMAANAVVLHWAIAVRNWALI